MDTEEYLKTTFDSLLHRLGADPDTRVLWADAMIQAYSETQRYYHTTEHIYAMLQLCQKHASEIRHLNAVQLAIFFHDWVYDPRLKDNEERSAVVFRQFASQIELDMRLQNRVARYIDATTTHSIGPDDDQADDGDLRLFLDFDLEVLSRAAPAYERYADEIRHEYIHMSWDNYKNGRALVLTKFLKRRQLYFSSSFSGMEAPARANLKREIESLSEK